LPALVLTATGVSCITVDGAELRERIVERNETERYYVCEITESSMPLRSHRSVLAVHGRGGQSHVGWSARFFALDAETPVKLDRTFAQVYRDGLESLRALVEGRAPHE